MVKQSSVEWLIECLSIELTEDQKMRFEGLFQQSMQMHQQEIEEAYWEGGQDVPVHGNQCKKYYNKIFKVDNNE